MYGHGLDPVLLVFWGEAWKNMDVSKVKFKVVTTSNDLGNRQQS